MCVVVYVPCTIISEGCGVMISCLNILPYYYYYYHYYYEYISFLCVRPSICSFIFTSLHFPPPSAPLRTSALLTCAFVVLVLVSVLMIFLISRCSDVFLFLLLLLSLFCVSWVCVLVCIWMVRGGGGARARARARGGWCADNVNGAEPAFFKVLVEWWWWCVVARSLARCTMSFIFFS